MRQVTTLPHEDQPVGVLWDQTKGNYDNWGRLPITTIVLHTMDGYMAGTITTFKKNNVSSHYGIGMDGKIVSFIPEDCVAYHSGKYAVNQVSIGIEHEDLHNEQITRSEELYKSSAQLVADICKEYNIPCDRDHIKKHNEIVPTSCPGSLDVERIVKDAREILTPKVVKMVEVESDVFTNLVTKSSEYDKTWKALSLDESLKTRPGSHQLILDYIQSKASAVRNDATQQAEQNVLDKKLPQIFSEFLTFLKLKKQS